MKLTEHFTLEELSHSDIALRTGIKNTASPNIIKNLKVLAVGLEQVRALLDRPLFITSGFRSPTLNKLIGGSANSAHCLGYAADFKCSELKPVDIVAKIKESGIKYDQCLNEGTWVHISVDPRMRQETLHALFDSKGKATYREFI